MGTEQQIPPPRVALSPESEKLWLAQEAAVQWHRISNMEDTAKERTKEHNAWMEHVSRCNSTNLLSCCALIVMAVTVIVLAVMVIRTV